MPNKFNADHRNKIPKQKHQLTNWFAHNKGPRQSGNLTVRISAYPYLPLASSRSP